MPAPILHFILATVWVLLTGGGGIADFLVGLILGVVLLALFHRPLGMGSYVRRVAALGRFGLIFLREFLVSNWQVTLILLTKPNRLLRPGFFTLDISGLSSAEVVALAQCITLTPGTCSVEIDLQQHALMVHYLDSAEPAALRGSIIRNLQQPLLAITRP